MAEPAKPIELPRPTITGELAHLLEQRRSVRAYERAPLSLAEAGQLAWAAQGVTHPEGLRTAPSAGALYPLELFLVAGDVQGLEPGVYHYLPRRHALEQTGDGDRRKALGRAAYGQEWLADAPLVCVLTAVYERTAWKYGERAQRYVHMEVGHAGQNLFLQAEALGLGSVVVGAFDDDRVAAVLGLPSEVRPLSLMPVGKKRTPD